jgi:hypothetical protein
MTGMRVPPPDDNAPRVGDIKLIDIARAAAVVAFPFAAALVIWLLWTTMVTR